ncbi:hypothetical protein BRD07_07370 [Halobacteriales archaeon QS_9_68_42]|nr:MAG: hypothetical protein BRD07_07370 [Halobacteriales archaeon QS_9_68_42]
MFRSAREVGPVFLIPAAWSVAAATHLGIVAERTLFIAHVVMSVLLAAFAVTAYADMREGTLRVWWAVIAVGFVPAAVYAAAPALPVEATVGRVAGIAAVGLGQTAGILDAALRY